MLLKGTDVLENIDAGNLSKELEIAKFRNYSREKFSDLIQFDITFDDFIENSSKFFSISLPKELSDYFIRAETAPYFLLTESRILKRIEDLLITKSNEYEFVSNYREIKNYYFKWLTQKTPKEKHYFANSIINSVERNFAFQSFFNVLVYGIVITYDQTVYNPKRASELFDRALNIVNDFTVSNQIKNEILYIIRLYKGFSHLKEYEYLKSLESFRQARTSNPDGITASFYCALSARYLDDFDTSYDYLREVLEFDQVRFKYAISFNHPSLLSFFYKNAVFYNVFVEDGFAQLLPDIDFLIRSYYSGGINSMEVTYGKLINLDNLRIKDFFDEKILKEIKFLKNALGQYKQKKIGLIRIVEQIFRNKLITLIEYIRNLIESYYFDQIKEEITVFDKQIEQNKRQLGRIKHEMEDASKKIQMNLDEAAEYLEETITERSTLLEEKLKSLDKDPKYNPSQVFYHSIIFTLFVSLLIFVVVGIISSMVGYGEELASMQLGIKVGFKWGGVTLAVGIFICIFTTMSSFWEKSSEKKSLVTKMDHVKDAESEERDLIHEDSERKKIIYQQKFKERIKTQEKIIENFIIERQQNYDHKFELAKKEIDIYISPLNELLNSFENLG